MSSVVNPRVRIAPAMSCASAYVVLVSHGYELIYERGFCNGVADAGVQCTLIGSDRTDPTQLRPGVTVVNLRGSQAPQRSRLSKLLNLLSYHLRLVWLVASRRPVVHVFGLIYPPVLVGIVEGCLFRLLENLTSAATAISSISTVQLMVDNLVVLAQSGQDTGAVTIDVPGGRLTVTLTPTRCVLSGPAVIVATGTVDLPSIKGLVALPG